jgi:protein ImuB
VLWLALHLPLLPLEALGGARGADKRDAAAEKSPAPPVVTQRRGARRWVIAAAEAAVAPGTDWSTVQLLQPTLRAVERRPRAEREAMQALAAWAYRYGSELIWEIAEHEADYGVPCALLWIEIGASLRLYGGLDGLLANFDAAFGETGHRGQRGVAPTPEAAALLARIGSTAPVLERAALAPVLGVLPLTALALAPSMHEALKSVGLSRIGELLQLPAAALGRRHGPQLVEHLDRLLGRRPDVRPRYRLPPRYQRRFDLLGEVEHSEGLLFPLQRLTRELADYLRARDTGLQEFRVVLHHGRGSGGRPQPDTHLALRLATPAREAERLLRVLREQLARQPLPAPVRALRLQAEQFIEPGPGQGDLFNSSHGDDEAWSQLLEKLVARLGADAVTALGLVADHRPERCWQTRACEPQMKNPVRIPAVSGGVATRLQAPTSATAAVESAAAVPPRRGVKAVQKQNERQAPAYAAAEERDTSPVQPGHGAAPAWERDGLQAPASAPTVPGTVSPVQPGHGAAPAWERDGLQAAARPIWLIDPPRLLPCAPQQIDNAERIEGGWWDGGDVSRDYYHAELHGGRFWVYQDRNSQSWFLQGIWA